MNPEKKLIYKVYTSIHIQFSTGRALSQRKEDKAPACLHVKCHTAHGGVSQVSVPLQSTEACHMAPAVRGCPFLWERRWCVCSAQKKIVLGIVFLNTCIYSVDGLQL